MKKILILCLAALAACYEDKGNYTYAPVSDIVIENVLPNYILVTGVDTLRVAPKIVTSYPEADLEYWWVIARSTGSANVVSDKFTYDTIHRQRDIALPIAEAPGNYTLYCHAKNRVNAYQTFVKTTLEVGTLYNRGHYILKETADGNTDLDLLTEDGLLVPDVINTTQGAPLPGAPRNLGILYSKFLVDPDTREKVHGHCLGVITCDKEVAVYRAFDMYRAFDHRSLFYEEPDDIPYKFNSSAYGCDYLSSAGAYHEHVAGILTAGSTAGKYALPKTNVTGGSDCWAYSANMWGPLYWDETHHRLVYVNPNGLAYELTSNDFPMPGPTRECLFLGAYGLDYIYGLFRDDAGNYSLYSVYIQYMRGSPVVRDIQPVAPGRFTAATLRATNERTANIIYFVHDNKLYYYDVANAVEREASVPGLPDDEVITHVANRHFNYDSAPAFDYFSIATYKNGHYKLFAYNMIGGLPTGAPVISASGVGRVKEVKYLAPNAAYMNNFFPGRNYSR
ncbi:MAG: hypothetical protein LBG30_06090 [Odoribacteraceae bacterium]|jgi:hypothetical protein|nr:hypothetical protein [Odoribacteraceae bacterium]